MSVRSSNVFSFCFYRNMECKRKTTEEESVVPAKRPRLESESRYEKELGDRLYVVVNEFRGGVLIHIRKYEEKNGKKYPTKVGAALTPARWNEFVTWLTEIEDSVNKLTAGEDVHYSQHLGGNWYVTINSEYPCVNIRKFWLPDGAERVVATRKGIALRFDEFKVLVQSMDEINCHIPELSDVVPCGMSEDHQNQMGMLRCTECNPNDYQNW